MKPLFILATLLVSTVTAHAAPYVCLGADEGLLKPESKPDPNQPLQPIGHLKGAEVRLLESDDGTLSLSIKKSDDDVIIIVAPAGRILFSEKGASLSCVQHHE
jgi:hypothetical protein